MTETDFNLLDEPWILVLNSRGAEEEVSILELFERAPELATIGGEVPTQGFAILRVLLAVLHRAVEGPRDAEEWAELWRAPTLPMPRIRDYAERHRERFGLFHPETPFFQVPGLHTAKNEVSGLEKIVADVPNGAPLFTTRSAASLRRLPAGEAARWLVHVQAFDPSGIKSGAVGDPAVKNGKGYPIGTGWAGQIGPVYPVGATLHGTLLLNLVDREAGDYVRIGGEADVPPWEREVDGPADANREPRGAIDLYTWQSRRVRLAGDRDGVTGVLLANGDRIAPQNRHGLDPHSGWRYSDPQSKKANMPVYMPRTHSPERAFWRGLGALLPAESGRKRARGGPQRFLTPGVLQWLGELSLDGLLPPGYRARVAAIGMEYGAQSAMTTEIIDDALSIDLALLRESEPALGQFAVDSVTDAENAASALWKLAENIARAAGAEPKSGAGDRAAERSYEAFDAPFRSWLAELTRETERTAARAGWHRQVHELVRPIAGELLRAAAPAAWTGRESGGRTVSVGLADLWFRRELARALPLTFEEHEIGTEEATA
jgi:CRISPR system Cascade subunit CasA